MSNQSDQPQQLEKKEQSSGPKKYILVAEDDKFYANIYRTKLTKEGYEVVVVGDGAQAMKLARQKKPDLILLDIVMPVKDGFETLKELKADANLKSVKVIVLSNLGQEEDIKKAKELGAVDYIVKANVSIGQMMSKIKSFIT
ncbi:response regulator [Patescibacteria group bacterium]|nr:response regulator [Patescibacteria group bacterium]